MKKYQTDRSLRRFQMVGYWSILVMVGLFGGWTVFAKINGAVIASATVVAESNTKRIQSKDGGIVRQILVKDGDRVSEGQPMVTLDDTDTKSELGIVDALLTEAVAKRARLEAERDGLKTIVFPEDLMSRKDEPAIASVMLGQEKLHAARRDRKSVV